ncbi:MAG: DNA polymerase [bacterium]
MIEKKHKRRLVLLDVHAILHRAYHALPDFTSSKGEPTGGLYGLCLMIIKIVSDLKPDYVVACFDLPEPTFRKQMYDEYKAGRKKTDEALVKQIIRSREVFEAFNIPMYEKAGFEADDMIGTIAEVAKKEEDLQVVIASGDLDTTQLIEDDKVVVYTLHKGIKDTVIYNEKGIEERYGFAPKFMVDFKGLRGDPSDNIMGIKGIGEKTAEILIKSFGTIEGIYEALRKDENLLLEAGVKQRMIELLKEGEEEAMFSKKLATIRRDAPIDFSLSEKRWEDGLELEKVKKLFAELEFRTLGPRLEQYLGKGNGDLGFIGSNKETESVAMEEIEPVRLKKAFIALWLINSEFTNPSVEDLYAFADTRNFDEVEKKLTERLKKDNLERVYFEIELPIISIIDDAEKRGILLDVGYLKKLSEDYHKKLTILEKNIWELSGSEFNINSPKQMSKILFEKLALSKKGIKKTAGGAISTKESELEKLKELHPIIVPILEYRGMQKLLSTYIDNLPLLVDKEGRLHTHLNQTGTTTGRMSSTEPNLQNIPARGEFGSEVRRAMLATPGYKLATFDYSQIEMRVLAWLTGDETLIQTFRDGKDIHSSVASKVFGVPESEVTKEMRRQAKVINFGIIYGMGVKALKKNLGSTMEEAEKFHNNYFEKFPKVKEYFDKTKEDAHKNGYTETFFGRRRYFPDINSSLPYIRSEAERMAMNAPIQGSATADIIKIAMSHVAKKIEENKLGDSVHILLQVHDELLFEIKDDEHLLNTVTIIKHAMENAVSINLPLLVNASIGDNWSELTSI